MHKKVKNIFSFTKSQKFQKWSSLGVFLVILLLLPLILFEVKQRQVTNQNAAFIAGTQTYVCNSALTIKLIPGGINNNYGVSESPDCSTGFNATAKSFQSSVIIQAVKGSLGAYAVHYMWAQFWCQNYQQSPCLDNASGQVHVVGLNTSTTQDISLVIPSDVKTPTSPYNGQACGVYQNDFAFYITDNSDPSQTKLCTHITNLTTSGVGNTNNNASWCNTNNVCSVSVPPTNTPTPTNTPVPSPTVTPVPTDTPTPGLTITPTSTPSATPTPTNTPTPTDTPIPGATNTPTPTPGPTYIARITPKPTLPSTGPGDTILNIGIAGIVFAVVGLSFAIGL